MGLFGKSTSKQTAKLKSLINLAVARLVVIRKPRLCRLSIARGDVGQLLERCHLDRALLRAEQVIDEDNMLEVLEIIELYCKILIKQAAQLEKPKECSEEVKKAVAGLIFASARCGELPELLDARAILADKFGPDLARAAKEGSDGVVDRTLVRRLSGKRASTRQKRRLVKEIAEENNILLDFSECPSDTRPQGKQSEQAKNVAAEEFVEQSGVKTGRYKVQGKQRHVDDNVKPPRLAQLSVEEKVTRESKKYLDARMAARAAVQLSRSESQGKRSRGGGYDEVHPVQNSGATEQETKPSWKPLKSSSPSTSWSDRGTVSSVGSEAAQKGKGIVFNQSDEEEDEVVEDVIWTPQLRRPPCRRTASTMGGGGGSTWHGVVGKVGADPRPFEDVVPDNSNHARPPHRRHASELAGGNAHALHEALDQRGQYKNPPYRRNPTAKADINGDAARREEELDGRRPRHQDGPGSGPLNPERRAISARTRI